jgi:hypothetical protein
MVEDKKMMTFDEYYDLFVSNNGNYNNNVWNLIRYYMLMMISTSNNNFENDIEFKNIYEDEIQEDNIDDNNDKNDNNQQQNDDNIKENNDTRKERIACIGKMIFNSYIERKGEEKFKKIVLGGLAHGKIHENWLRRQFEILTDENENFDYVNNWNILCINNKSVFQALYLLRLMWTELIVEGKKSMVIATGNN